MNVLEAMQDPELFAKVFKRSWVHGDSWAAWKVFLRALFALPMDEDARAVYQKHAGRTDAPATAFQEAFVVAGRRSGKSLIAAMVAVFLACFKDYSSVLAPGEVGTVMIIAADRRQARVVLGYINAFFQIPMLNRLVVAQLKESVELSNRIRLEIHTSSFRAVRGYSIVAAVCDELAYWPAEDSASPDSEVLNALRPAMATVPGALLLCISSPYARRGELWRNYKECYGKPSDVLVWKSGSREMNPTLSAAVVAAAYLRDAASARAEFGGEFRDDIESFISLECVEARVVPGRFELPPVAGVSYVGFTDPSGGQADSFTLAIAHVEKEVAVLDVLREVAAPFSPEQVVAEFSDLLKHYHLSEVTGDRYAGEWPREQFQKRGIEYRCSEKNRSELYVELLPMLTSGQAELLDSPRLVRQLVGLERKTGRIGKDSIDHAPNAHDDLSNAAAGAIVLALCGAGGVLGVTEWLKGIAAGIFSADGEPLPAPAATPVVATTSTSAGPSLQFSGPSPPPCPSCKSTCVQKVSGQWRCSQCAAQWWPNGEAPHVNRGPSRRDYVGRGIEGVADEFSTSPLQAEREKTLRRFAR